MGGEWFLVDVGLGHGVRENRLQEASWDESMSAGVQAPVLGGGKTNQRRLDDWLAGWLCRAGLVEER